MSLFGAARRRRSRTFLFVTAVGVVAVLVLVVLAISWWRVGAGPGPSSTGELIRVQVLRVVDGDTVDVSDVGDTGSRIRVRVLGIDTPELARDGRPADCYGVEAKSRAEELLRSSPVVLVGDPTQPRQDRYGRRLAYLSVGDDDLGAVLVREGFAREYHPRGQARPERTAAYEAAEAQARAERRGRWGKC